MISYLKKYKLLVFMILIYGTAFIINQNFALNSLVNSSYFLLEMLQVIPIIFILTVIIDAWVPKELIIKRLGKNSGFLGVLLSIIFGSISAGPIYAAFPITKMLLKKGASVSNIVIILSAWAVIKLPMLVNEVKFLGFDFMIIRWILTVFAIISIGYITSKIVSKDEILKHDLYHSKETLSVLQDYCIGCGICSSIAPDYFKIINQKAQLIQQPIDKDHNILQEVANKCPVKAIKY